MPGNGYDETKIEFLMATTINIGNLKCLCSQNGAAEKIAYILYPMDFLANWIEPAAKKYGTKIVVITGMDWQNVFSPWAAPGVPKGTEDFKGESPQFLKLLQEEVIPKVESSLQIPEKANRTLIGVSMSGLFTLWQWMICDTFENIASLSGSFWYEGFIDWFKSRPNPHKTGEAFFLLGDKESKSKVKAFNSVEVNTREMVAILKADGIKTEFEIVPGDHYSDPIPRLNAAFESLFSNPGK